MGRIPAGLLQRCRGILGATDRRSGGSGADKAPASSHEFRQAYEALGIGHFWSSDAQGAVTYLSPDAGSALGAGQDWAGLNFADLFVTHIGNAFGERSLAFVLGRKTQFRNILAASGCDESRCNWLVSGSPRHDETGNFAGFVGHIVDVTRQHQSEMENLQQAQSDPLTGLGNRRHMSFLLDRTVAAHTWQGRACATMLIDLDRFKQVNDTLGHPVGDELLRQVAERMAQVVGERQWISRMGGDEFQVILPDFHDRAQLAVLATAIIAALSHGFEIDGHRCQIGASIGIAVSPEDGRNGDELTRHADLALYAAKHAGRGQHCFFNHELLLAADAKRQFEEDLHGALPRGEFELVFQPIVESATGRVTCLEALTRWRHPERGWLPANTFIPTAEKSNAIMRIGEWTLRRACEEAATWPQHLHVAVNLSAPQLADRNLPGFVATALAASGIEPSRLELEIPEDAFLSQIARGDALLGMLTALKRLGVRLVLDDFGTGLSPIGYLKNAPFDRIKIDNSFIHSATDRNAVDKALIGAIVNLAMTLGLETTAERVESMDQLDTVRSLGVSHVQGHVFSKPVPCGELAGLVGAEHWTISPDGPARQRYPRIAMFRSIGLIHEDHYYQATLRNISRSGALVEGVLDVPLGTSFVADFGEGQFALGSVKRSHDLQLGIQFSERLVDDGRGGLCTRHRVLPKHLQAAAIPLNPDDFLNHQARLLSLGKIPLPHFTVAGKSRPLTRTGPHAPP